SASSFDYQIITWLLSLYGKANSHVPGLPGRKNSIQELERPCLTIFATAQPAQLIEAVTVSDLAAGLVNRFVLFDAGDKPPPPNFSRHDVYPSRVEKQAKIIKQLDPKTLPLTIQYDTQAVYSRFRDFDEEARRHAAEEGDNEIW